jgi:tol-pal system protein YbgF
MRKSPRAFVLSIGMGIPLVVACTHQHPADRTVEKLRAEIAKIEADREQLDQRVGALEAAELRRRQAQEAPARKTPPSAEAARSLPIVRVREEDRGAPPAAAHGDGPDLEAESRDPRPIVRASGSRGGDGRRASKDSGGDPIAFSPEAKRDYDAALGLARAKQHDKALQALTAFLVRYPDHPYVENAMYWRGECFFATGAFDRAAPQFEGVIARFPYGNKAPDALLKLGLSHEKIGAREQALKAFADLKDRYPKSDAARQVPHP